MKRSDSRNILIISIIIIIVFLGISFLIIYMSLKGEEKIEDLDKDIPAPEETYPDKVIDNKSDNGSIVTGGGGSGGGGSGGGGSGGGGSGGGGSGGGGGDDSGEQINHSFVFIKSARFRNHEIVGLNASLDSGKISRRFVFGNRTQKLFLGNGEDIDERLAISNISNLTFIERESVNGYDYHGWFVATYNTSSEGESYMLRAKVTQDTTVGRNLTTVDKNVDGSWVEVCEERKVGDTCDIGNVSMTIASIYYVAGRGENVTFKAGSGTSFNMIYDENDYFMYIPVVNENKNFSIDIYSKDLSLIENYTFSWSNITANIFRSSSEGLFNFSVYREKNIGLEFINHEGSSYLDLFFGNRTQKLFLGNGKDIDERLAISNISNLTFIEKESVNGYDYHGWFVATYNTSSEGESYMLRAKVTQDTSNARNETTIDKTVNGTWVKVCEEKTEDDTCDIGNVSMTIASIYYVAGRGENVTFKAGSGTSFNMIYDENDNYFVVESLDNPVNGTNITIYNKSHSKINNYIFNFSDPNIIIKKEINSGSLASLSIIDSIIEWIKKLF